MDTRGSLPTLLVPHHPEPATNSILQLLLQHCFLPPLPRLMSQAAPEFLACEAVSRMFSYTLLPLPETPFVLLPTCSTDAHTTPLLGPDHGIAHCSVFPQNIPQHISVCLPPQLDSTWSYSMPGAVVNSSVAPQVPGKILNITATLLIGHLHVLFGVRLLSDRAARVFIPSPRGLS